MTAASIVAWNVGPRPWRRIVRSLRGIRQVRDVDVVALFEASQPLLVAGLRVRYPHRRVICRRSDVVAILPRRERPRVEVISHDVAWRGPHLGRAKRGRRWLLLTWPDSAVLLVHRVTPVGNQAAWDAETDLIRSVVRRADLPSRLAVVGDHNGTDSRLRTDYAEMGLHLLPAETKVDQCAVRGMIGAGHRLGLHGSDHVAVLWRLWRLR